MSRKLILCLDGTWNSTFQKETRLDGTEIIKPTNVLKMARAILPRTQDNVDQVVYYDCGVGSLASYKGTANWILGKVDNILGGMWGAGLETNIEDALTFLSNNYLEGDEIFIYGFSRGAATARAVCNIVDWMGGIFVKQDAYFLPHFIREYLSTKGKGSFKRVLNRYNNQVQKYDPDYSLTIIPASITFLGVWDTVLAKGCRVCRRNGNEFLNKIALPKVVLNAAQALAIDERRSNFLPNIWLRSESSQNLQQRWFAGVHSNVGGSYPDDGLANCALAWMICNSKRLGLEFNEKYLSFYRPSPVDVLYDSNRSVFRIFDRLFHRSGIRTIKLGEKNGNLDIDYTVFLRLLSNQPAFQGKYSWPPSKQYRPINLIKSLAEKDFDENFFFEKFKGQITGDSERTHPEKVSTVTLERFRALMSDLKDYLKDYERNEEKIFHR